MSVTWLQFKTEVKKLLTDVTASDDLFASACAAYVSAAVAREVDHDLLMRKSYYNDFTVMRRRLLGYNTTLVPGSTLDVEVKKLLPVDAEREGITTFVTQQIKNAYYELTSVSVLIEKLMREAVIDLQSHIQCYRVGTETAYTTANVTTVGNMSRGPIPDQAELLEGYYLEDVPALAISTAYQPGDYVSSNGRTYRVLSSGTLTSLGSGLTTTDGTVETLDGVQFTFFYGEACFRSRLVTFPWERRFQLSYLRDGNCSKSKPAMIAIDEESFSFFVWPKLDATHRITLFWNGLKFNFADGDNVPFDEGAQEAVREFVLAKYFNQVEQERQQAGTHETLYATLRARLFADCSARRRLKW